MNRVKAFVLDEDVRRIAGFVAASAVFAVLAWQVYLHIDHDQWAPMFFFFALAGLSAVFALMTVFSILKRAVLEIVSAVRRPRQTVATGK